MSLRSPQLRSRLTGLAAGSLVLTSLALGSFGSPAAAADDEYATTYPAEASSLGAIPDASGNCETAEPGVRDVQFVVSDSVGDVVGVSLDLSIQHAFTGDVTAVLIAPDASLGTVFQRTGTDGNPPCGSPTQLDGTYTFNDAATQGWWAAAAATAIQGTIDDSVPDRASDAAGADLSLSTPFAGVADANGIWTLRVSDNAGLDTGSISGAELTLTVSDPPPDTEITAGPAEGSRVRPGEKVFEFTSPDPDTTGFECAENGGEFAPCTSPVTQTYDTPGPASFLVRAVDARSVDASPAARTFEVRNLPCERATKAVKKGKSKVVKAKKQLKKAKRSGNKTKIKKAKRKLAKAKKQLKKAKQAKRNNC